MRRFIILYSFLLICFGLFAQAQTTSDSLIGNQRAMRRISPDSLKNKLVAEKNRMLLANRIMKAKDTLVLSDYVLSIERVNDNLISVGDSAKIPFQVVKMSRRVSEIKNDIGIIRLNTRGRRSGMNIKNLYLYQSLATKIDVENDRIQAQIAKIYKRIYRAKLNLRTLFTDTVFKKLYADSILRHSVGNKLVFLERRWIRTDSIARSNIDSLNNLKVRITDNAMSLDNMLSFMDLRLDRARHQLFGKEVTFLWQTPAPVNPAIDQTQKANSIFGGERKSDIYYFNQSTRQRTFIFILGGLLFIWLFMRRSLLKIIKEKPESFEHLQIQYLKSYPILAIVVILLSLMPFFDAYAPLSYTAIEFMLLLLVSSIILFRERDSIFRYNWLVLLILFVADVITYQLIEPSFVERIWLLVLHVGIIIFTLRFYKGLSNKMPYYLWIKRAAKTGIVLTALGILCNLFGRFSLSGLFGIAAIFAVTQAVTLPVFIDSIVDIILIQIQSSRLKKGITQSFDCSVIIKKLKGPLFIVAIVLWLIMLTSNLNIYHSISNGVVDLLMAERTIGSITYRLISIAWFFAIIWVAHILQRLISFLFGETGLDTEDVTVVSKEKRSRLLVTRLLLLIGGYLLAIAASGLPIDKLTFVLGALGVGIGMGLQNVVNNFVSGIILIFDGSLKIGDQIEVAGQSGKVKEIGLRASILSTGDGAEVMIPNGSILSQNITNWTFSDDEKRVIVRFSLSGKELDANKINEIINQTISSIPNVTLTKKPVILYTRVTHETYWLNVRFWSTINFTDSVKSEAMFQLNKAFTAEHLEFK